MYVITTSTIYLTTLRTPCAFVLDHDLYDLLSTSAIYLTTTSPFVVKARPERVQGSMVMERAIISAELKRF